MATTLDSVGACTRAAVVACASLLFLVTAVGVAGCESDDSTPLPPAADASADHTTPGDAGRGLGDGQAEGQSDAPQASPDSSSEPDAAPDSGSAADSGGDAVSDAHGD
jgi:hypothetical protein